RYSGVLIYLLRNSRVESYPCFYGISIKLYLVYVFLSLCIIIWLIGFGWELENGFYGFLSDQNLFFSQVHCIKGSKVVVAIEFSDSRCIDFCQWFFQKESVSLFDLFSSVLLEGFWNF
ncbi:hypothetical protein DF186_14055, partial [Enterococcus hirae]